jgi:hypothetical protein
MNFLLIFKVSVITLYKSHNNWRQIIKTPLIPICDVFSSDNLFISNYVKFLKSMYTTLPFKCPIKPGRYYQYNVNVSQSDQEENEKGNQYFEMTRALPNGIFQTSIYFETPEDPKSLFVQYYFRIKKRLNDETF